MIRIQIKIILILLLANSVFGQDTTYFDSNWKESNIDEAQYYRTEKKIGDKFERMDFFKFNNQIQMIGNFSSLNPDIKEGKFKWYHSNGKIKHEGEYFENKEIGIHTWYFDNGKIEAIENYNQGNLEGEYKEFYQNGNPSSETYFSNGIQNGMTKYYRENGSLHSEGEFKNGDRNGIWTYYDESGGILGTNEFKTNYIIEEANMFIKLPNSEWNLTEKKDENLIQYYFKRSPIIDENGIEIVPAIMIFIEDASEYEQNIITYSIIKRKPFMEKGIKVEQILIQDSQEYPLTYKNGIFMKCSYNSAGLDHILYMIHIINKNNKGIQI